MTAGTGKLGGRLPLLDPRALVPAQRAVYDRISATFGSWADRIHFQSKTDDGRLIGPFNPILHSPEISTGFLELHDDEGKYSH
jgi:4-carboxymuconolactone decarboxylase